MNRLLFGKRFESQKIKLVICLKKIIGGDQLDKLDLVDQILKFFTGYEKVNFLQIEAMF